MVQRNTVCPKCQAKMEAGLIPDEGYSHTFRSKWVEGIPEKGFFFGLKLKGRRQFAITTYRCTACGYLESFAGP
jgi:Domain of unknown function (DUF6487)